MAWHSKIASEGRPVQAASARRVWTTFVVIKLSSRFNFIVLQVLSNLTVLWIFQLSNDIRPDPNKLLICQQYQNYYKRIISDIYWIKTKLMNARAENPSSYCCCLRRTWSASCQNNGHKSEIFCNMATVAVANPSVPKLRSKQTSSTHRGRDDAPVSCC